MSVVAVDEVIWNVFRLGVMLVYRMDSKMPLNVMMPIFNIGISSSKEDVELLLTHCGRLQHFLL